MGTVVYRQLDEIETVSTALRNLRCSVREPELLPLWWVPFDARAFHALPAAGNSEQHQRYVFQERRLKRKEPEQ